MTMTWILVANASEARLYASPKAKLFNGEGELSEIGDYHHPESRQKSSDFVTDRSGRRATMRSGSGTCEDASDPKSQEADNFARQLADQLASDFKANRFQDLIIAAPPQFHGLLNKYLSAHALVDHISINIEKDYTKSKPRELLNQLQNYL